MSKSVLFVLLVLKVYVDLLFIKLCNDTTIPLGMLHLLGPRGLLFVIVCLLDLF